MKRQVYTAPAGYVYDWVEPHYNEENEPIHLYAKKLSISRFDNIDNYKLEEEKKNVPST